MSKPAIFRDKLPGERKSIINMLMTGYLVVVSILGYMAFYLSIQFQQMDRIIENIDRPSLSAEQRTVMKDRLSLAVNRMNSEIKWIALLGSAFAIIGGAYTYNMVIKPLRKLVLFAEEGKDELPEIKSNNEIKQIITALYKNKPQV